MTSSSSKIYLICSSEIYCFLVDFDLLFLSVYFLLSDALAKLALSESDDDYSDDDCLFFFLLSLDESSEDSEESDELDLFLCFLCLLELSDFFFE